MNAPDHYRDTKDVFNLIAEEKKGFYDADFTGKLRHSRFQLAVRKTVAKIFDTLQTAQNLEVGCGNGDFLMELARKYPTLDFQGRDFSEKQIQLAKEKSEHSENIRFEAGNALTLELGDNSVDTVFCINVLHHITPEDQEIALGELARVAKTDILVEMKNAKNFYYQYLRTGFGAHTASFHYNDGHAHSNSQTISVYPTTQLAVTTIFKNYSFELTRIKPLWAFSWLSPLIVLHFKNHSFSV